MRAFLAALALACALLSPGHASAPGIRVGQMARDVTDAVRKQRSERRTQDRHPPCEGKQ